MSPFWPNERAALTRNDPDEIKRVFGYVLARCPGDREWCLNDAEWAHPCDRDERGEYECLRLALVIKDGKR